MKVEGRELCREDAQAEVWRWENMGFVDKIGTFYSVEHRAVVLKE